MSYLKYVGPAPAPDQSLPLPEGWSGEDHEDLDEDRVAAKLAYKTPEGEKLYRRGKAPTETGVLTEGDKNLPVEEDSTSPLEGDE